MLRIGSLLISIKKSAQESVRVSFGSIVVFDRCMKVPFLLRRFKGHYTFELYFLRSCMQVLRCQFNLFWLEDYWFSFHFQDSKCIMQKESRFALYIAQAEYLL